MTATNVLQVDVAVEDQVREESKSSETKVLWANSMPFVGVKYYAFLDEQDTAQTEAKIGPVDWRASGPSSVPFRCHLKEDRIDS